MSYTPDVSSDLAYLVPHDTSMTASGRSCGPVWGYATWRNVYLRPQPAPELLLTHHQPTYLAIHKLCKPKMPFHLIPAKYAGSPLPALEDWEALWETWDTVSQRMMPDEELLAKPIKLRNACIFYLGHIPTFLDLQLTKTTGAAPTEPAAYAAIFERGIDPDVDNPELCHAHSEMPDEWPPVAEILAYQDRVRARLRGLYADGVAERLPRPVGQAVWAGFEHEAMHLETLLYMMLQSDRTLPPPHAARPDFEKLAARAEAARVPNPWFDIPAQIITIGMDDPEDGTDPNLHYGWCVVDAQGRTHW